MKFGIATFPTDYSITPSELGQAVEERAFDSLWFPEHTHIPTSRKSPWPGGPNLPDVYKQTLDPFMALTAAAVATKRIKLATGIVGEVRRMNEAVRIEEFHIIGVEPVGKHQDRLRQRAMVPPVLPRTFMKLPHQMRQGKPLSA